MWFLFLAGFLISISGGLGKIAFNYILPLFEFKGATGYAGSVIHTKEISIVSGRFLQVLCLGFFILFKYNVLIKKMSVNKILIPIYIFGALLFFLFRDIEIIYGRTYQMLCLPVQIIILPSILLTFRKKERILPFFFIILFCVLRFVACMQEDIDISGPYESILQFLL
jgi:hypothetical protein